MNRIVAALAVALSLASAAPVALAAPAKANAARHQRAEHGDLAKKFPMKAEEFKAHIRQRTDKAREHLEKAIARKQLPADKANEVRAKFNAVSARVDAKVTEVCADGTVTLDEAKQVWAIAREAMPQHKGKKASRLPAARDSCRTPSVGGAAPGCGRCPGRWRSPRWGVRRGVSYLRGGALPRWRLRRDREGSPRGGCSLAGRSAVSFRSR